MQTQAQVGFFKPKHQTHVCTILDSSLFHYQLTTHDPKGFKSATKRPGWTTTMNDEIQALQQNQT